MEPELLWSAEQIKVPPNLADVLKAFTKEVLRQQPTEIFEFAAGYFTKLAAATRDLPKVCSLTVSQVQQTQVSLEQATEATPAQLAAACASANIDAATSDTIIKSGGISGQPISVQGFLVLLLTAATLDFTELVKAFFVVFGRDGVLDKPQFLAVMAHLGKVDPSVTAQLQTDIVAGLTHLEALKYDDLQDVESLRGLLSPTS